MSRPASAVRRQGTTASSRGRGPTRGRRRRLGLRRGRIRLPRVRPRVVLAVLVVVAVLGGAWLWLRDSSLVGVRRVTVVGVGGPDAAQIRAALVASAQNMTTLDVQMGQLRTAVAPYPVVKGLDVSTQFPHGMRIRVSEQVPVAAVVAAGRRIAVSADGTLLHDVIASPSLPAIDVGVPPGGTHLTGAARSQVALLAAAPYRWLGRVSEVSDDPGHGLMAQLRNGPRIYFGGADRLGDKWDAASQVLADPGSVGAVYIDVTDPSRPAAGSGSDGATTPATATGTATTTATTASTPAAPASTAAGAPSGG